MIDFEKDQEKLPSIEVTDKVAPISDNQIAFNIPFDSENDNKPS